MKKLLALLLLLAPFVHAPAAHAQQFTLECIVSTSTACPDSGGNPGSGTQGTPLWQAAGDINFMFNQVYNAWGPMSSFLMTGTLTWADEVSFVTGTVDDSHCPSMLGHSVLCGGGGGGSISLSAIQTWTALQTFTNGDFALLGSGTGYIRFQSANTSSTNYTATFPAINDIVVMLTAPQTLTNKSIDASEVNTGTFAAARIPAALSASTSINGSPVAPAAGTLGGSSGSFTLNDCVKVASTSPLEYGDAGLPCGSGSGGNAVTINGGSVPTLASFIGTNGSGQPVAVSMATATAAALQATTPFTVTGTGCTPSIDATYGAGPFSGVIDLASGPCTFITITINGATGFTAPHGYSCSVGDKTTQSAGTWIPGWIESGSTQTQVSIPIPAATGATDKISVKCDFE